MATAIPQNESALKRALQRARRAVARPRVVRIQTDPIPECPVCEARMILVRPEAGQAFRPYWRCSGFPECAGQRKIDGEGKPVKEKADAV